MNGHIQYFKKYNLTVESEDGLNLKIKGLSFLPGEIKDSVLGYARAHKDEILFNIATQKRYDELWAEAWTLADWVDDPNSGVPVEERAARVPELMELSEQLDRLLQQPAPNPQNKPLRAMVKCLHGLPCRFIFVKDHRQMCRRNQQPIFDLDACPIGKWFKAKHTGAL